MAENIDNKEYFLLNMTKKYIYKGPIYNVLFFFNDKP